MNFVLFMLIFSIGSAATAQDACPTLPERCEDTLSKTVRSQVAHYWCAMQQRQWPADLQSLVKPNGVIFGDAHLGNFAVIPVRGFDGRRQMRFVYIDFDDAGQGSFALDFLRYIIATKSIERDIKRSNKIQDFTGVTELFAAYQDGLNGKALSAPARVQELLEMSVAEYDTEVQELIAKRLSPADNTKLAPTDEDFTRAGAKNLINKEVAALYTAADVKVLDVIRITKTRGGSSKEERYWSLAQGPDNKRLLNEFKGWRQSALSRYKKQLPPEQWAASLYPIFWKGLDPALYDFKKIKGHYFWLREKRKVLLDVPYESAKKSDLKLFGEISAYVANQMGLIHGRQSSAKSYVEQLQDAKRAEAFKNHLRDEMHAYLGQFKIL